MQRLRTVTSLDVSAVAGHHAMPATLLFCQTEGISMLRNELIEKEMVECSQTSKSKGQKRKIKVILNIVCILCYNSS